MTNVAKRLVAVVTGGSAGVGRATVRELARQGFDVAILARGADGLDGARRDVEALGGKALALSLDVANHYAMDAAAQRIEDELGPIDVWINCAMASVFAPFHETTLDEFERVTRVTYLGTVHGTWAALQRMRPRRKGKIVQVGSALAYRSIPLQAAYCGSKAAIRGFTDSVRCELLHDKMPIGVTMVQLPAVNTPQFGWVRSRLPRKARPVPPIFQPEVAARAIVWAATHEAREIKVGASSWTAIVLGAKLFPRIGDAYLAWSGYSAQQTGQARDRRKVDNLFRPVPGDHGAHGSFDRSASTRSPALWATLHARGLGMAALAVATLLFSLHRLRLPHA